MSIYLGNIEPKKYFVGDKEAKSVWIGGTKVWEKSSGGLVIDGQTYRTVVMPDGREWMAENLNTSRNGTIHPTNPSYGYFYTSENAKIIANSVDGWNIPSYNDFQNLIDSVENAPYSIQEKGWSAFPNALDLYGFGVKPLGVFFGSREEVNNAVFVITDSNSHVYSIYPTYSKKVSSYLGWCKSVRLIKDA